MLFILVFNKNQSELFTAMLGRTRHRRPATEREEREACSETGRHQFGCCHLGTRLEAQTAFCILAPEDEAEME